VTLWARLTWQAADPAALAADLGRRLGAAAAPGGIAEGAWVIPLGRAELEVRPWRREAPGDEPQAAGRLVFEPVEGGEPQPSPDRPPLELVGVGWSTVQLDRAEGELEAWLGPSAPGGGAELVSEPHLGARTRTRLAPGLPGGALVFAEPVTEGRLAASLARDGEGPCALYLRPADGLASWLRDARPRGVPVTPTRRGPFGASVLLAGGAVAGPHVVVVDDPARSSAPSSPGTIGA
jgi:hypothetical protein